MSLISSLTKTLVFSITILALTIVVLDGVLAFIQATNLIVTGIYEYLIPLSTFYMSLMLFLKIITQKENLVHATFYISSIYISLILLLSNLILSIITFTFLASSFLIVKYKKGHSITLNKTPNLITIRKGVAIFAGCEGLLKAMCTIEILNPENLVKNSIIGFLNAIKLSNTNISMEFHKSGEKIRLFILTWFKGKNFEKVVKRVEEHVKKLTTYLDFYKIENQVLTDEISIEEAIFAPILNWSIKKLNINIDENYTAASLLGIPLHKPDFKNIAGNFHLSIILTPVKNCEGNLPLIFPYMSTLNENKEFIMMIGERWDTTIYLVASKENIQLISTFFGLKMCKTSFRNLILREHLEEPVRFSLIDVLKLFPWVKEELKIAAGNS